MIPTCEREQDVVRLALSRRWPDGSDADLQRHVETCAVCGDAVMIAAMLGNDREALARDVRVPAAGQVWWRAALRAHSDAAAAARRPLVWLQGIAGACAVALMAALLSAAWPSVSYAAAAVASLRSDVAPFVDALRPVLPLALAALACLVLTPIVVYLALSDE